MKRIVLVLSFLFFILLSQAQVKQNIKGQIIDKNSEMPLPGATVTIIGSDPIQGSTSDLDGFFRIENIEIGRYDLSVTYIGFAEQIVPNVEVVSGKEVFLNIQLEENIEKLDEVVITAKQDKSRTQNEMTTVSARTFSVEEVNRYSGGRSDVARLATNFAGVSTSDDARNDIVIRGNSPTGVLWKLEGIPIPSPNHFATLGTTGGPVSALNPNMIKNSDFLTSAFPAEYGNALAGVFDLGFRRGNKDKSEFMLQMGAISGFEGMAEGPLNKKGNGSYLVAGRYSFVGLASDLGLNIGTNASPNYWDLSYNFDFGKTKIGQLSLFGISAMSDIEFLHDEVDDTDIFAANDEDSFAESIINIVGLKQNLLLDDKSYLRTIISFANSGNIFSADRYFNQDSQDEFSRTYFVNDNSISSLSLSSFYNKKYSPKYSARTGILLDYSNYDLLGRNREFTPDWVDYFDFEEAAIMFQAFYQAQYRINNKWTLNGGLRTQVLEVNENWVLEPRLALEYKVNDISELTLGYGIHHQIAPLPILLTREETSPGLFEETNKTLTPTRSQHLVLGYNNTFAPSWRLKAETYYQYIDQVPVDAFESSFSLLNLGQDFGFPDDKFGLVNEGTGENYGIELTLEKFFSKNYYTLFTTSLYESRYTGSDGIERNTAFNNNYVINVLAGKEFLLNEKGNKKLTVDGKFTTAGGRNFTPIDLEQSQMEGQEVLIEEEAFSQRYDPYLRLDLKFGLKINSSKKNITHHFFFDLQNVTNAENIFIQRYNRLTNEVNDVYQTSFFPDFMYRVQF
ncbi:MAG: TonB-dependent receptor [Bacteroidota bacterium]